MNARTLIEQVVAGAEPRRVLTEGTKISVMHLPDSVVAKVIHTMGTKAAYLDKQQVRINCTKQGEWVRAEIIPSHGPTLHVVLTDIANVGGGSRLSLTWDLQMIIVEIL